MSINYLKDALNTRVTPQNEPITGTVKNSAGGYSFAVDNWKRLERFLILGTEGGSYYASERDLTKENVTAVQAAIKENGPRAVQLIVEISDAGRAAKNDPAIYALALAASAENENTRKLALEALPKVARTGTHLFHFLTFVQNFRGWGRSLRSAVGAWYTDRSDFSLATQLLKYQSRDGWSHRDALRLAHPKVRGSVKSALVKWAVTGELDVLNTTIEPSNAYDWARAGIELLHTTDAKQAVKLIADYKLPRELVPTQFLNSPETWEALLPHMGYIATIRNLATMTRSGLLVPLSDAARVINDRLKNAEELKGSRVHPIQILSALKTYGGGVSGSAGYGYGRVQHSWTPVPTVVDGLNSAFYLSFGNITKTNKRFVLGIDVSGSMRSAQIAGLSGLSAHEGAAVMSMVTARVEPEYHILGFDHGLIDLKVTASDSLQEAIRKTNSTDFGGTDCALPLLWALEKKVKAEMFCIYTDSETWAGKIHPVQALKKYRETTGIPARLAVMGMVSNGFSIADPNDAGMIDLVGFDAAAPEILAQFALGNI